MSEYLVGVCSVGLDSSRQKESAISKKIELCWEWWEKPESQILSLMLISQIRYSLVVILELNGGSEVQHKDMMMVDDGKYQ